MDGIEHLYTGRAVSTAVSEKWRFFIWAVLILGIAVFTRLAWCGVLVIVVDMAFIGAKILEEHT
jgi:hypothetical protein